MTVFTVIWMALGASLFFGAVGCLAYASGLLSDIAFDVNRQLPKERKIDIYGWFGRYNIPDVLMEYKRLFPDGELVRKYHMWAAIGLACGVGMVFCWIFYSMVSSPYAWWHR